MTLSTLAVAASLPLLPRQAFPWSRPRHRLSSLSQLVLRGVAPRAYDQAELQALLLTLHTRQHHQGGHVSGALLHHADTFFYCLEGPEQAVIDAFARLGRDGHHESVEELLYRPAKARLFPRWMVASTAAVDGSWLDDRTIEWEFARRRLPRAAASPVGGLLNHAWEGLRTRARA